MKIKIIAVISVACLVSMATTFRPVSIKNQLKEADGIVIGEVTDIEVENHQKYNLVTNVEIAVHQWHGVEVENDNLSILFPGGTKGDQTVNFQGSPEFSIGEKIAVVLKFDGHDYWVQNLALGKFSIKKVGKRFVLISSVFSHIPYVGQIELEKFKKLVTSVKGESLRQRAFSNFQRKRRREENSEPSRAPASVPSRSPASSKRMREESEIQVIWFFLLLGLVGGITTYLKGKREE